MKFASILASSRALFSASSVTAVALLGHGSLALADELIAQQEVIGEDGYNKTYNSDSKSFGERMKSARSTPVIASSNEKGGFYLGVNGIFGQIYDAEPKNKGGSGYGLAVEPGFVIQNETWSRIELSAQIAYNSFTWKVDKSTVEMAPISFMPQIGWGINLGNNLYGVTKVGFGLANGELNSKFNGNKTKFTGSNGSLVSAGYDLVYAAGTLQFHGGLGVTHYKYSWSDATASGTDSETGEAYSGVKFDTDHVTNINYVNLHGGVRIQF